MRMTVVLRFAFVSRLVVNSLACSPRDTSKDLTCLSATDGHGVQICEAPATHTAGPVVTAPVDDLNPRLLRRFKPLRSDFARQGPRRPELVNLGRMLYFDRRLSRTQSVSCNSCHSLDHFGTTDDARAPGFDGKRGPRNAPSTYNAAAEFTQFWDGRAADVETQVSGPLLSPVEMGMTAELIVAALSKIPGYVEAFSLAFPGDARPMTLTNIGNAIGAFERGLATPSRWDQYLGGDRSALSEKEKEGLRVFTSIGCMVCHTGELVGGSMFEKLGAAIPWPNNQDHGRASVTHNAADEMMFKVPSLRNVAHTAPYFHDGSVRNLDRAVQMMAAYQLGEDLTPAETEALVAWLGCLSGEIPTEYIKSPILPGTSGS